MKIEILVDADAVARKAAAFIAAEARAAIAARGRFTLAVSGGRTPWQMLRVLATEDIPWPSIDLVQVDERVAPAGDPNRNLTHVQASLLQLVSMPTDRVHAMPVDSSDLETGAAEYAAMLQSIAGRPPVLDLIHLGLGPDGHTASLTPGDPVLNVADKDVAMTGIYQGHRRMTLTYPILNRARQILWLVTGGDKRNALRRLRDADRSIPAGRVRQDNAIVLADHTAADAP
jgi:6-phosphogluconolactonase